MVKKSRRNSERRNSEKSFQGGAQYKVLAGSFPFNSVHLNVTCSSVRLLLISADVAMSFQSEPQNLAWNPNSTTWLIQYFLPFYKQILHWKPKSQDV